MKKTYIDHTGKEYKTLSAMCKAYGIKPNVFGERMRRGKSLEKALTDPSGNNTKALQNQKQKSRIGEIKHNNDGLKMTIIRYQNSHNIDVEFEDGVVVTKKYYTDFVHGLIKHPPLYYDHLGKAYPSKKAMCNLYGISLDMFNRRIKDGWPLEQALTTPKTSAKPQNSNSPKHTKRTDSYSCYDHLGIKYSSINQMCSHYNLNRSVFGDRIQNGWTLEEALTTKGNRNYVACVDHLGNEYNSISAMCRHYGMKTTTFTKRKELGWNTEDALTKNGKRRTLVIDHLGNEHKSITKMCEHWNITKSTYDNRKKLGWDIEKILTTPTRDLERNYIGFSRKMNNGFMGTLIKRTKGKKGRGYVYVLQYEDGSIVNNVTSWAFLHGKVRHPLINKSRRGFIFGIKIKCLGRIKQDTYYESECPVCGWKDIAMPHEIISHSKNCQKQ